MTEKGTENIHVMMTAPKFTLYYCSQGLRFSPGSHSGTSVRGEPGETEPLGRRQTPFPAAAAHTTIPLFSFIFSFLFFNNFIGSTVRKSNSRAPSKKYCCIGPMSLLRQNVRSNCPLGQRAALVVSQDPTLFAMCQTHPGHRARPGWCCSGPV